MLTAVQNELLTRVGAGTPCGEMMRRYWQPIAAVSELEGKWTKRVRLLGEDLVLFRDKQGRIGLITEACPHRRASLALGIPTDDGIRCPYHGWEFGHGGQCLAQPNEPEKSSFRHKIDDAGLFGRGDGRDVLGLYGPGRDEAAAAAHRRLRRRRHHPHARQDAHSGELAADHGELARPDPHRMAARAHLRVHQGAAGQEPPRSRSARGTRRSRSASSTHGITKHRLLAGHSEDSDDWRIGHPVVFPNILSVGNGDEASRYYAFQIRVPVDDTHTLHLWYTAYVPPKGETVAPHLLDKVHVYDVPLRGRRTASSSWTTSTARTWWCG